MKRRSSSETSGPATSPGRLGALLRTTAADSGLVAQAPGVAPRALLRRFWPYARPYRKVIAAGLVLVALVPAIAALEIWLFKVVVDDVIVAGDIGPLAWIAPVVLGLTLLGALLSFGEDYTWTWAGERFLLDLRTDFFSHVQDMSWDVLHKRRLGDLISRMGGDIQAIEGFVLGGLAELISAAARIVFFGAALALLDWQLALIALVVGPPFYLAARHFAGLAREAAREKRRRSGSLTAVAEESLANAALVQSVNAGGRERERIRREGEGVIDAELTGVRVGGAFSGVVAVIEVAGVVGMIALGTWAIGEDRLTIGGLLAFLGYLSQLLRPVGDLSHLASTLLAASAGAERVIELLDRRPQLTDRPGARDIGRAEGEIELDGVTFGYPGAESPALVEASLRARPGELVVVTGASGAGKSTLVRLLARFADPERGAVLLDGRDLRELTLESVRSNVGLLLQETLMFDTSVRDSIAFARPGATDAEVEAAARTAGAHEFVVALPDGYATRVGQRGRRLSGGQRRRIEIARTLLRDTPVVVLDEPTAGLDEAAATDLLGPLRALASGRTTIVISHDIALIENADRVLHVEAGNVAEEVRS